MGHRLKVFYLNSNILGSAGLPAGVTGQTISAKEFDTIDVARPETCGIIGFGCRKYLSCILSYLGSAAKQLNEDRRGHGINVKY